MTNRGASVNNGEIYRCGFCEVDELAEPVRTQKRLVALHIDVPLGSDLLGHFGHPVGASQTGCTGDDRLHLVAVALIDDALIVGCDDDAVSIHHFGNLLVATAKHRLTPKISECFAWKAS